MILSFLVTVHNEDECLDRLLSQLVQYKSFDGDCEVIVLDDYSTNPNTKDILDKYKHHVKLVQHKLDMQFGKHKQFGNSCCTGDYIFQVDSDELFTDNLLYNIKEIIRLNESVELFMIPRVNTLEGLTADHVQRWGWRMSTLDGISDPVVNWPDFQFRLYKNASHIRWERDLHEFITGAATTTYLDSETSDWALLHNKTISKQEAQNNFYVANFSNELNSRN